MKLNAPYVRPGESNASNRAVLGVLGVPGGSPCLNPGAGLGIDFDFDKAKEVKMERKRKNNKKERQSRSGSRFFFERDDHPGTGVFVDRKMSAAVSVSVSGIAKRIATWVVSDAPAPPSPPRINSGRVDDMNISKGEEDRLFIDDDYVPGTSEIMVAILREMASLVRYLGKKTVTPHPACAIGRPLPLPLSPEPCSLASFIHHLAGHFGSLILRL